MKAEKSAIRPWLRLRYTEIATKTGLENLQNLCRELSRENTAGSLPTLFT